MEETDIWIDLEININEESRSGHLDIPIKLFDLENDMTMLTYLWYIDKNSQVLYDKTSAGTEIIFP